MRATETSSAAAPGSHRRLAFTQAMAAGAAAAMDADPSVLYLGPAGAPEDRLGIRSELQTRFGPARVADPPADGAAIAEQTIEAASSGRRPIVELTLAEPLDECLNRIASHLRRRRDEPGAAGMVLIVVVGGDPGAAEPTPCRWGRFVHLPGAKVVVPSNPYDAKGLLISAVRDGGPVVYVVHRGAMGRPAADDAYATAEVPEAAYEVPIGRAAVARSGTDVTVVTVGRSVHRTLEVAGTLAGQGIDTEVIDLRSLVPLDRNAVVDSVTRTGRLVVVDEDALSYGLSGEVAASVTDVDPAVLRVPVQRVAHPDPSASRAEPASLPGPGRIEFAIRRALDT